MLHSKHVNSHFSHHNSDNGSQVNQSHNKLLIMHRGGIIWQKIISKIKKLIKPGTTTISIDKYVGTLFQKYNLTSAPLKFYNLKQNACISVNSCLCHGIPSDVPLKHGDVVSVDISFVYREYCIDAARTFVVTSNEATLINEDIVKCILLIEFNVALLKYTIYEVNKLLASGEKATYGTFGAIMERIASDSDYIICKEYGGHRLGLKLHEEPFISSISSDNTQTIAEHDSFCVEPIISFKHKSNRSKYLCSRTEDNGVFNIDDLPCSHYENTYYMIGNRIISLT